MTQKERIELIKALITIITTKQPYGHTDDELKLFNAATKSLISVLENE